MSKSNGKTQPTPDAPQRTDRFKASLTPECLGVQPEFVEVLLEEAEHLLSQQLPEPLGDLFRDFAWIYYVLYEAAKGGIMTDDSLEDFAERICRFTIQIWKHGGEFGNSLGRTINPNNLKLKTAD